MDCSGKSAAGPVSSFICFLISTILLLLCVSSHFIFSSCGFSFISASGENATTQKRAEFPFSRCIWRWRWSIVLMLWVCVCKAKRGHNIKNTLKPGARIQEQCKGAKKQNSFLFVLDIFFFVVIAFTLRSKPQGLQKQLPLILMKQFPFSPQMINYYCLLLLD